jgi:transposase-like protein
MGIILSKEQLKSIIKEYDLKEAKDVGSAVKDLMKDIIQEMMEGELESELGYSKYDYKNKQTTNSRNGHSKKKVRSSSGEIELSVPRDRAGEFEPIAVKKYDKDVSSIEDRILSMYAKGMSSRDIQSHMEDIYGINVSNDMVSRITDKILPIVKEWQKRPLAEIYPILYMDAMVFNVKQDGQVIKKSAYAVLGYNLDGFKEILGIWISESESAKFWLTVLNELKNRGVKDILITTVDGLTGFEAAIKTAFPETEVQRCIVHQIRNSTKFVSYKDRKQFCNDMKEIYKAPTEEAGREALRNFRDKWGKKYSYAIQSWETNWDSLATFFKYPEEIRKIIYTTNAIESYNNSVKKVAKTKGSFPSDDALLKTLYLSTMDAEKKWSQRMRTWNSVIGNLIIYFGDRITRYL